MSLAFPPPRHFADSESAFLCDSAEDAHFLEERTAFWPNAAPEGTLPDDIEHRLLQALECVGSESEYAIVLSEEAIALARAGRNDGTLARTLLSAAGIVQQARRPDRAYLLCLEAEPLLERRDDRWRSSHIQLLRGQCWLDVGEHERALALIAKAAERFRLMENRADLARCLSALAMAHRLGGQLEEALSFAEQAVATLDTSGSLHQHISARNVVATIRVDRARRGQRQGDSAAAHAEFERAAAVLPAVALVGDSRAQPDGGLVLQNIAQVSLATGDESALLPALRRLAVWSRQHRSRLERGMAWLQIAQAQRQRGCGHAAVSSARAAVRHLAARPSEPRLVDARFLLADLLEQAGDTHGAYESYAEAARLETEQQREAVALRAELLALDRDARHELISTEQTLAYAQRLSNVGHLVASVNHELNQPMASISMLAGTALELIERGEHEEVVASMRSMLKLSTRLTDMTAQLAAFPVESSPHVQRVSLRQAVLEALAVLRSRLTQTPCEILLEFEDEMVLGMEAQLVRVIVNLVHNALDALEMVAQRRIRFGCTRRADAVLLSVHDNGHGMSPTVHERLFQPFFSTKTAGRGLGLGLALSREVMREMGGDLAARDAPGVGAVFEVTLRTRASQPA